MNKASTVMTGVSIIEKDDHKTITRNRRCGIDVIIADSRIVVCYHD